MPKLIDITNERFGRLIVLKRDKAKQANEAYWLCQCDCGNIKSISGVKLRKGLIQSCGCLQKEIAASIQFKDLTNKRFGYLTVIEKSDNISLNDHHTIWKCQCDCGNITYVRSNNLITGNTTSCGCIKSKGESLIKSILKELKIEYEQEKSFYGLKAEKLLRFDIYLPKNKIAIEYQGIQHFQPIDYFGGEEAFKQQQINDKKKIDYCKQNEIQLIAIPYWDFNKINKEYILSLINNGGYI